VFISIASIDPTNGQLLRASGLMNNRAVDQTYTTDAKEHLLSVLSGNTSRDALERLENLMRSTFSALPKDSSGHIGHQATRYLLHRFFIEQHGWFIKGLEASEVAPAPNTSSYWVPSYLQGLLEQHVGDNGVDLHAVAALALSVQDFIGRETTTRFQRIRAQLNTPQFATTEEFKEALSAFMMVFRDDGSLLDETQEEFANNVGNFKENYAYWDQAVRFIDDHFQKGVQWNDQGLVDVEKSTQIVQGMGSKFYEMNDRQCQDLKKLLTQYEDVPGRMRLTTFYNISGYTDWEFGETPDYLRALGALEEVAPGDQRVITTNYIQSMPNCIDSSSFFNVCCRNECEDLMAHLEKNVSASQADGEWLLELVAALPSDTVTAPREIPTYLQERLKQIATAHNGKVPLHSRLFAQWMHHAYPRECPYPHTYGSVRPFTADDWMKERGEPITFESRAHAKEYVRSICDMRGDCESPPNVTELSWSTEEELPLQPEESEPSPTPQEQEQEPPLVVSHRDENQSNTSKKETKPRRSLQSLATIMVAVVVVVHIAMNPKESIQYHAVRGAAAVLFTYVSDPIFVIATLGAGLLVTQVLPHIHRESEPRKKWQQDKLFYEP